MQIHPRRQMGDEADPAEHYRLFQLYPLPQTLCLVRLVRVRRNEDEAKPTPSENGKQRKHYRYQVAVSGSSPAVSRFVGCARIK
jgi:hypothetical protein